MNRKQFGQVSISLANAKTVGKSHISIERAAEGIVMK